MIVVTGLFSDQAEPLGDGGGDHSRACGSYLTGVHVKKSDSIVENAISMDQIAAKAFERDTQLSSLQMTADENSLLGSCDLGYSCAYSSTLSWLTPTLPLMAENNPRVLFERMFGASDSTDARVRAARLNQDRSLLDSVNDRVNQLQRKLGDRRQSQGERLSRVAERRGDGEFRRRKSRVPRNCRTWPSPPAFRTTFEEHVRLLYDLQLLAYQSDLTRVITFMYGREQTGPALSADRRARAASSPHAPPGRPGEDGEVHAAFSAITSSCLPSTRKVAQYSGWRWLAAGSRRSCCLAPASATATGTRTARCPPSWWAEAAGTLKGGRHLVYPEHTPLTNLQLTLLNKLGVPAGIAGRQHRTIQGAV